MNHKGSNRLSQESSLYLQQHANNPVDWFPWGDEAFAKAKSEEKLILISIGYSSCHWCHVMEQECFEDKEVAEVMNTYFVCIKVDREERPDIDQIYMNALQLMSGQGGWPLNCFVLPDGRPIYGGTYFPKEKWISVLHHLHAIYKDEYEKVDAYAEKLTQGVNLSDQIIASEDHEFEKSILEKAVNKWKSRFDTIEGGPNHAPKFPLPNNYLFLLRYGVLNNDAAVLSQVKLTLDKMAYGGIYDQIGGGFMRYSTDMIWKVPHFEKMLYDNAQLISLYSEAYRYYKQDLYKEIVYETIEFCDRYWLKDNAYCSSTDADSEGEEGKFYVWTKDEFKLIAAEDYEWAKEYYNLNQLGFWEEKNYILLRRSSDEIWSEKLNCSIDEFKLKVKALKNRLRKHRAKRIHPVTDTKQITSWNALLLLGFCDAYKAFNDSALLEKSLALGHFIMANCLKADGGLYRIATQNDARQNAFLEDYAFVIESFLSLYEISSDENWLQRAENFFNYTQQHFYDDKSGLFFFTSDLDPELIARKTEYSDNVTPSSNSSLAKSIFYLYKLTGKGLYKNISIKMLRSLAPQFESYPAGFSNWMQLYLHTVFPSNELVIVGEDHQELKTRFFENYHPNVLLVSSPNEGNSPLLKNRFKNNETLLYLCTDNTCNLPVQTLEEVYRIIK